MDVIYREEFDRWIKGDRHIRPFIRTILRPRRTQRSGMQTVVWNFLLGLRQKNVQFTYNRPFFAIPKHSKVISFGLGVNGVRGLSPANPVIAAIGFPYPGELPELCKQYNIRKYLVHSNWILNLIRSADIYDRDIFDLWPAGIDTTDWKSDEGAQKKDVDVLIYNKIHWDKESTNSALLDPICEFLRSKNYSFSQISYGTYSKVDYQTALQRTKVMVFLSAHESQGMAYQECLSSDVPVIAWDQGYWLDPIRHKYGRPVVPATSVPFFDQRCGVTFPDFAGFASKFETFFDDALSGAFRPREYILENLSIEKSTDRMLAIYDSI